MDMLVVFERIEGVWVSLNCIEKQRCQFEYGNVKSVEARSNRQLGIELAYQVIEAFAGL